TRCLSDWSSDVCSSDLFGIGLPDGWENGGATIGQANAEFCALTGYTAAELKGKNTRLLHGPRTDVAALRQRPPSARAARDGGGRSEERRGGKGGGAAWA